MSKTILLGTLTFTTPLTLIAAATQIITKLDSLPGITAQSFDDDKIGGPVLMRVQSEDDPTASRYAMISMDDSGVPKITALSRAQSLHTDPLLVDCTDYDIEVAAESVFIEAISADTVSMHFGLTYVAKFIADHQAGRTAEILSMVPASITESAQVQEPLKEAATGT